MAEYPDPEWKWLKIGESLGFDPQSGTTLRVTAGQERAIREYASTIKQDPTLRGMASIMRSQDWDYYDILKLRYGRVV